MKKIDAKMIKFVCKVAIVTLLTVIILRSFFIESYTISTSQMESELIKGDEVLVNKLYYGPRLPTTVLSLPFAFDKFYSDLIQLPYKRLFSSDIFRNDIVVFNSPQETDKPLDKRSLLISRCIAIPGDTILISDGIYYINNRQYVHSPTQIDEYVVLQEDFGQIKAVSDSLFQNIHITSHSNDTVYFTLNRYDAFILSRNTPRDLFYRKSYVIPQKLMFIAPSNGRGVSLTPNNIKLYRQIIEREQGNKASFDQNGVYINGQKIEIYTFQDDYYWMLSDNTVDALDSRVLGFIPFSHVVGRATTTIYSLGNEGFRPDRFFRPIR